MTFGSYRNAWEPVFVFSNGRSRGFAKHQTYASVLRARSIGRRTAKPYELYDVFIEMSSRPGELVVDPFCGINPLGIDDGFSRRPKAEVLNCNA